MALDLIFDLATKDAADPLAQLRAIAVLSADQSNAAHMDALQAKGKA